MLDKEKIVQNGYSKMGSSYQIIRLRVNNIEEINKLIDLLPQKGRILDAGCGTGLPVTKYLIESGFDVIGIDFSDEMLRFARKNVPEAEFIKQNIVDLSFPNRYFDALISLYAIIHIPREKHETIFRQFNRILKPGGIMLVTMGSEELEENGEFLGERMFWSHFKPEKSKKIIEDCGFNIIEDWFTCHDWFSDNETHYWIIAKKIKTSYQ
jgi:ubiquinone/menaquinone biosynthesis C-methylase UbiE